MRTPAASVDDGDSIGETIVAAQGDGLLGRQHKDVDQEERDRKYTWWYISFNRGRSRIKQRAMTCQVLAISEPKTWCNK